MTHRDSLIAVAWGSPGGATAEISIAVEELTGKRPRPVRLGDLAGPNETIQVLLAPEDWILVAKAVAAIYGAEIVKEAAKSNWKAAAPKFTQASEAVQGYFGRIVLAIRQALHAKAPVVLGLPRTPVAARRHIGIEIQDAQPEDIARVVALLAEHGAEIESRLDEWDQIQSHRKNVIYEENSDCSVKLTLTDDGSIQLSATISDDHFATREVVLYVLYTPSGRKNS